MYPYGLIGNCQVSALVSNRGSIDWLCLPRPDSAPIFGKLLDPAGGQFSVSAMNDDQITVEQAYLENTNILVTEFIQKDGSRFRVTDFCPRFEQFGRMFRPNSIFRVVEPIVGAPLISVACQPVLGWSKTKAHPIRGNSHLRFEYGENHLRLTTNMPLTFLYEESTFSLKEKLYFALTWNEAVEEDLAQVSERFLLQTQAYWKTWVKHCSIPTTYQKETIRSALALKLHCYEDTGAILAALTTSLPEESGSGRNWDYRYCWLRDAHFVLSAFHKLGHFEEMEGFLKYFLGIAQKHENSRERLAPVYTLGQELPLPEMSQDNWRGYGGEGPVRVRNQAAEHIQNDVYGEMILTLAPIYFDERFVHLRDRQLEDLFENLALLCERSIGTADAGLWEIRDGWQEHSFTNLMCWAGLERYHQIQQKRRWPHLKLDTSCARARALEKIKKALSNGAICNGPKDDTLDASLALATHLRLPLPPECLATVEQIRDQLSLGKESPARSFFYRYVRRDDFGCPGSAFLICSFWVVEALAKWGHMEEARKIFADAVGSANHLGLLSEHFQPAQSLQLGNFPQAYSHVGLINAAFAISPPWSEVL